MRPWKSPNRPTHEISQSFNDGIINIFTVSDVAKPGRKPVQSLTQLLTLKYEERKLGIQRYYSGQQNQTEISRVIRVPQPPHEITNTMIAATEKSTQYRIRLVQMVRDVYPPCYDLTLERITQTEEYPL